jgi:hypothetical protein
MKGLLGEPPALEYLLRSWRDGLASQIDALCVVLEQTNLSRQRQLQAKEYMIESLLVEVDVLEGDSQDD